MRSALDHLLAPVNVSAAARIGVERTLGADGVALTFDDGPHPEGTPAILELLAQAGARATFFLVGEQVVRRPELAARIGAEGHRVGLHGGRHRLQLRLSRAQLHEDLERGLAAIEDACGTRVALHRPPYGIYSPVGLDAVREHGMRPLLWSRWGKDWRRFTTPERIASRSTREIGAGDVILLHDADFYSARGSHRRTAQALPAILDRLNGLGHATVLPV
jgi:peptidoglycan/xylan/chitin deacetylase (PgdA/CDA1 family)